MSDGMSDARNYGPSLSKHGAPIISRDGKPVQAHGHKHWCEAGQHEYEHVTQLAGSCISGYCFDCPEHPGRVK